MFATPCNVIGSYVDDTTSNGLSRRDNDVVILRDLEGVERLSRLGKIENTGVDGVGYRIVDKFTEDQAV